MYQLVVVKRKPLSENSENLRSRQIGEAIAVRAPGAIEDVSGIVGMLWALRVYYCVCIGHERWRRKADRSSVFVYNQEARIGKVLPEIA